jgi:CelD/BcsL family acetyltransferase involved in cellulose biosynthesis
VSVAVETIRSAETLAALPAAEWDTLVLAQPRPSPFLLHAWVVEWARHYEDAAELQVHVARRDGELVAALPLIVQRVHGLRLLQFVGATQSALGDLLLRDAGDREAAAALVAASRREEYDLADLFGLPGESRLADAAAGESLRLIQRVEAPVLDLTPGWDEVYRAKTGSKKRNLHRRRRRQLAEQGSALDVDVAGSPDELAVALEDAFRLHELRWAGRPDGSHFATPVGKRLHRAAIQALAPEGIPRIVTLRLDGRAIAFHYFFLLAGRMYVHRLAFDPALARFSPGLVNTLDALEVAAAAGATRVEYLGGDERYKLELSDGLEPLHQGLGLARTPQGRAVAAARLGIIHARRRLKRSPRLRRLYVEGLAPARRLAAGVRRATAS